MARVKKVKKSARTGTKPVNRAAAMAAQHETTHAASPRGQEATKARLKNEARNRAEAAEQEAAVMAQQEENAPGGPRRDRAPQEQNSYVLLSGEHFDNRTGLNYVYEKGKETIVTTSMPLDEMFMNKFRKKDGETSPGRDYLDVVDRPALMDAPLAESRPHGFLTQLSQDSAEAEELEHLRDLVARYEEKYGVLEDETEEDDDSEEGDEDEPPDEE